MVVDLEDQAQVDRVFRALADATRRDIVVRVLQGECSVSTLAALYPMSFAAVQKHVAVLERAALVSKQRQGREQIVRPTIATVHRAARLLEGLDALWRSRIDRMADLLAQPHEPPPTVPTGTRTS